jgi:adenine-specific DNA glycosylase
MNKKTKLQNELSEAVKRTPSSDDCPVCSQHFWCSLNRESHMKLYPSHLNGSAVKTGEVEAAVVENLQGTVKRRKRVAEVI